MHPKTSRLCWERDKGRKPQKRVAGSGEWVVKMLRKRMLGWGRKWFSEREEEGEGIFMGAKWSQGGCVLCKTTSGSQPWCYCENVTAAIRTGKHLTDSVKTKPPSRTLPSS